MLPTPLAIPVIGTINGNDEIELNEKFRAMFAPPAYDEETALANALALLPQELHQDQYYVPLALIYANVPVLKAAWSQYCFKPGNRPVDFEAMKKGVFGLLSNGELFLAQLGLHLFNDYHKLPKDGLLGLRNLDSEWFELAMHAIRIFTRGL